MSGRTKKFITQLLFAFGFLSIIPGLGRVRPEADDIGKSSAYFALPGLLLGVLVYLLALIPGLSPFTRAVLAVLLLLGMTRGLHADGVIDTFDGFLSGKKGQDILQVMKDSRIGALGWVGAFGVYLLKVALLYEVLLHLPESHRSLLILPPVLSRGGVALHAYVFPPARREDSLGERFLQGVGLREVIVSIVLCELLSFRPALPPALMLPPAVLAFWMIWGLLCRWKIDGITGDTIGSGIEFAEVLGFVLVLLIILL
jgi:adenosylcobinamide-GDP ribazoletransferase